MIYQSGKQKRRHIPGSHEIVVNKDIIFSNKGAEEDPPLFDEDFESYAVAYDMTSGDWTHTPWGAEPASFDVTAGNYGECTHDTGTNWAGGFHYDGAGASAWSNYEVTFDVISYASGRFLFSFRTGAAAGYWLQCLPGVASESRIMTAQRNALSGATILDSQTSPSPVTSVKIAVNGSSIKVYYNGSASATHDISDATYATGTIGVSAFLDGWEVDNIVVTEL